MPTLLALSYPAGSACLISEADLPGQAMPQLLELSLHIVNQLNRAQAAAIKRLQRVSQNTDDELAGTSLSSSCGRKTREANTGSIPPPKNGEEKIDGAQLITSTSSVKKQQ